MFVGAVVSRPTLKKWLKRYQENGVNGLIDQTRKPRFFPQPESKSTNNRLGFRA